MAWVMRLTSGEATTADAEALNRWRAESQAHRQAFAEANLLWDKLGPAMQEALRRDRTVVPLGRRVHSGRPLARRALLAGMVAAAAGFVIVRPPFALWPSFAELTAEYRTGKGERRRITVAGSVSVELNTETSVTLRPGGGDRSRIELISGEAAIATNGPTREPIEVLAGGGRAMATDAQFNIRLDGAVVRVACLEGAVQVACDGQAATIQPGQQIAYGERGLSHKAAVDPEVVTAWQHGLLVFRYVPLAEVVEEINRYRPGRVFVMNVQLGRRSVVANFRLDQLDEAVDHLAEAFGAHITTLPDGIVLLS
jgi:transmembrane sensor